MRIDSVNYNDADERGWVHCSNKLASYRPLYFVIGMGGSGKDTFVDIACDTYGMTKVKSYTTRPRRSEDEDTHYFVTENDFWKKGCVTHFHMNGYDYGATMEQLNEADFYVVDPFTAFALPKKLERACKVILLDTSLSTRIMRMISRGDSQKAIGKRIQEDVKFFGEEGGEHRRLIRGAADYYVPSVSRYVLVEAMNTIPMFSQFLEKWSE